jgi:hypothetical protein
MHLSVRLVVSKSLCILCLLDSLALCSRRSTFILQASSAASVIRRMVKPSTSNRQVLSSASRNKSLVARRSGLAASNRSKSITNLRVALAAMVMGGPSRGTVSPNVIENSKIVK